MIWDYQDGQTLEDCLYAAIHIYEDSRDQYYDSWQSDAKEVVETFDRIGKHLIKGLDELPGAK